jgi:hypothetical protein
MRSEPTLVPRWPDLVPPVLYWPRMVNGVAPRRPRFLVPAPAAPAACARCGAPGRAYHHPNPLRTNVLVYRCYNHSRVSSVVEDPKAAPGGGRYR